MFSSIFRKKLQPQNTTPQKKTKTKKNKIKNKTTSPKTTHKQKHKTKQKPFGILQLVIEFYVLSVLFLNAMYPVCCGDLAMFASGISHTVWLDLYRTH